TFSYKFSDGALDSNLAIADLTITPVNDAPVASNAALTTAEDAALTVDLRVFGHDVDSASLTPAIVAGPAHGSFVRNADGTFTYTPAAASYGADSFTYKVSDGQAGSNVATVTLQITPVNDAPVARDTAVTTAEDTALALDLRSFGYDVDSANLTAT